MKIYTEIFSMSITDNNPLTYVLSTAKVDAMRHRWIAGLANYNFHIHYKSGKSNVEADALSRIDWEKCDETIQAVSMSGNNHSCNSRRCSKYTDSLM